MTGHRATWIRRALLALALLAAVWAALVALTGGFVVHLAGVRVSSRQVRNPILLAFISTCAAAALSGPSYRRVFTDDLRWWWSIARTACGVAARLRWGRWVDLATLIAIGGTTLLIYQWAGARPLWLDEEMIALNIRDRSLPELAGSLWLGQSAPFGWLAAQRVAMLALGLNEAALRLVPLIFAVATLAIARWMGRRWMTPVGAGALVLLCSLGPWVSHYALEMKHYSADMFFALLLPALVVWAIEADGPRYRLRRAAIWWGVAVLGQWWANGALFVTPACALLLWISLWRLDGRRSAVVFAVFSLGWLVSFGLYYLLALRFTVGSDYLREYWSMAMPPASARGVETVGWLIRQAAPLAVKPGGTEHTTLFWTAVICGVLFARHRILGCVLAAIPLSAFVLAASRLVPLYERLSLWTVPALYVGIALCIEAGVRWVREAYARGHPARVAVAVIVSVIGLGLCADIAARGWREVVQGRPRNSNHEIDDRTGVKWLLAQQRPGDAVLTTHLALPAVWWYGGVSVAFTLGRFLPDGSPILEVSYDPPGPECDDVLRRALTPYERVLVYFGFRDVPEGFDDLLLHGLDRIGRVTDSQRFAGITRAAIVELAPIRRRSAADDVFPYRSTRLHGCVSVRPATRW